MFSRPRAPMMNDVFQHSAALTNNIANDTNEIDLNRARKVRLYTREEAFRRI